MTTSPNRRYILGLWVPVLVMAAVAAFVVVAALVSGKSLPALAMVLSIAFAGLMAISIRLFQKARFAKMLQAENPVPFLQSFAKSMRRIPHGELFAAANSATILALYGRFGEAERALETVSWGDVPPLVEAQAAAARATIAYARGCVPEGLDHAVAATQQASLGIAAPGAQTSDLAFRTYRNLGLALAGRATESTADELRSAFAKLPLVGQILAAWGLAALAQSTGQTNELVAMEGFIQKNAPHCRVLLASIGAADSA